MYRTVALTCAAALATVVLTGCSAAPTAPTSSTTAASASLATETTTASNVRAITAGNGFELQTSFTVAGDLYVGNVVTLNLTVTNISGVDDPYGTFGWLLLSNQVKRTQTPTTANPKVLCEAYRGHQGGLTQAVYDDFCRVWFTGPIAAGQSLNLAFPIKLLSQGTWNVVAENSWGVPDAQGYYPNIVRLPLDLVVGPAPPKVGGGGTSGLPDLLASVKASTGSPAAGSAFSYLFTVKNSGKSIGNAIPFTTVLPAGLTFVSANDDGAGTCVFGADRTLACTVDYLLVGQTRSVQVNVLAPTTAGAVTVTGTFGAPVEGDSNLANNSATTTVTVK